MPLDISVILELLAFVVLMGLSAFFSSSETSLFSLTHLQLEKMRLESNPRVTLIERLLSQPRHLIVTILIGNELVNVAASVISAALVIRLLGAENKWVNLLIMIPILLLVGEITPKTLAIRNSAAFASAQCRSIDLFARLIAPLRWTVRQIADVFITLIVGRERSRANILTEDMVRSLAEEAVGQGVLDKEEALYIKRIFDFGDKTLRDVMTPRSQILFLAASTSVAGAATAYRRTGHTKIPVYEGSKDRVVGVLYVRDLLGAELDTDVEPDATLGVLDFTRDAYFVPQSKSVADLFYTFRKRKLSLALTVDEYGGITGLVSMEDLLECIFGDILSRSEILLQHRIKVEQLGTDTFRFEGSLSINQVNRLLSTTLSMRTAETIGGLLLETFGELPSEGRDIVIDGYQFEVVSIADRRIAEIIARPAAAQALSGPDSGDEPTGPEASAASPTSAGVVPPGRQ